MVSTARNLFMVDEMEYSGEKVILTSAYGSAEVPIAEEPIPSAGAEKRYKAHMDDPCWIQHWRKPAAFCMRSISAVEIGFDSRRDLSHNYPLTGEFFIFPSDQNDKAPPNKSIANVGHIIHCFRPFVPSRLSQPLHNP